MATLFLTFDYELFFGGQTGTVEKCLIQPTYRLLQIAKAHQAKFTFFVDVLYLMKLKEHSGNPTLKQESEQIETQLKSIIADGHDIQLHLHTHWMNAMYDGEWKLDYPNYRIHNFSTSEIEHIVKSSVEFLEHVTQRKVFAFRAGGWCLQPFEKLRKAFVDNGIWLDSTVFQNGYSQTPTHFYDFRDSPDLDTWSFNHDPLQIDSKGYFTELPISSFVVSPLFFWRMLFFKIFSSKTIRVAGDGKAISKSKTSLIRMLLTPTHSVVSCDGYKASMLESAFQNFTKNGRSQFVIIGHPKAMNSHSFGKLDDFLLKTTMKGNRFLSINNAFGGERKINGMNTA